MIDHPPQRVVIVEDEFLVAMYIKDLLAQTRPLCRCAGVKASRRALRRKIAGPSQRHYALPSGSCNGYLVLRRRSGGASDGVAETGDGGAVAGLDPIAGDVAAGADDVAAGAPDVAHEAVVAGEDPAVEQRVAV